MTNEELREYVDANGDEHAVEKIDPDDIDDPETRKLFEDAHRLMEEFDEALAAIQQKLWI